MKPIKAKNLKTSVVVHIVRFETYEGQLWVDFVERKKIKTLTYVKFNEKYDILIGGKK